MKRSISRSWETSIGAGLGGGHQTPPLAPLAALDHLADAVVHQFALVIQALLSPELEQQPLDALAAQSRLDAPEGLQVVHLDVAAGRRVTGARGNQALADMLRSAHQSTRIDLDLCLVDGDWPDNPVVVETNVNQQVRINRDMPVQVR